MKLNDNEKKILKMCFGKNIKGDALQWRDCLPFYRTPHYIKSVLERMSALDYMKKIESGGYIITDEGKEAIGIEMDAKLEQWTQVKK